jgi:LIVCS family branched-chain amino acid:cation transporter
MNRTTSTIITVALAIFSMFFGAGNLIFPLATGVISGQHFWWGLGGFISTAVLLPLLGLVTIILFNGDYEAFFNRVGRAGGFLLILFCMFIIGPLVAMPRIVTLTHEFLAPFTPAISLPAFSALFCGLTFLAIYKESKVMNILAYIISPALLISLGIIIVKGLLSPTNFEITELSSLATLSTQAKVGYQTLDLLGAIFFGFLTLTLLKKSFDGENDYSLKRLAVIAMKAGLIACSLICILYVGIAFLGAFHGQEFIEYSAAQRFIAVCIKVMGAHGGLIIAAASSLACYSTLMALAVVLAEFIEDKVTNHRVSYISSLVLVLTATGFISCYGLTTIMEASSIYINTLYPAIITLTLCNLAYKLWGFKPVTLPVLVTLVISVYCNFF